MVRSRNEVKERRGLIACISMLLIPILFIGGFYLWLFSSVNEFGASLNKTSKLITARQSEKLKKRDEKIIYSKFLGNKQKVIYSGIIEKKDSIYTHTLQIESVDSTSIAYRIEKSIKSNSKEYIKGVATIDLSSLGNQKWTILDQELSRPAFRFIDESKKCPIEILTSKSNFRSFIAIVNEICKNESKEWTGIMKKKTIE